MSEHHRLGSLQVSVTGNYGFRVTFGKRHESRLHILHMRVHRVDLVPYPQPERSRHLIVPAAARVELAARVADRVDQFSFDKRMDVLGVGVKKTFVSGGGFEQSG